MVFSQRGKVPLIVGLPPPRATPRRRTGAAASPAAAAQAPSLPILNLSAGFAVWDTRPGLVLTRPDPIRGQCCGAISEKSPRGQCCGAISEKSQGSPRPRRVLHEKKKELMTSSCGPHLCHLAWNWVDASYPGEEIQSCCMRDQIWGIMGPAV